MAELIKLFLKLGFISFGGPAAHVAMMEEEFVHRRQWISREKFLDLVALTQIIPGPNSTELAIHIGYLRAGWWGFWIAGLCFILPAFCLVTAIAYFYQEYSSLPQVKEFLLGVNAVVLAVIVFAFARFLESLLGIQRITDIGTRPFWADKRKTVLFFILAASIYLKARGSSEMVILFTSALISVFIFGRFQRSQHHEGGVLFWIFFKIGALLFGSGYVLISFLQTELIERRGWITQAQLLDAVSVGQFTPGPVFTTASFIGYLVQGFPGAVIATAGIFAPAFLFVALSIPLYQRFSESTLFRAALDGVVAGSLGLLAATLWTFGGDFVSSPWLVLLFVGSGFLIWRKLAPTALLIVLGGLISLLSTKI